MHITERCKRYAAKVLNKPQNEISEKEIQWAKKKIEASERRKQEHPDPYLGIEDWGSDPAQLGE